MTAFIVNGEVQNAEDWYAWFFDRQEGYWQVSEDWYAWFNERAPINTELNFTTSQIEISGDALILVEGAEAEAQAGQVIAQVPATAVIQGLEVQSSLENTIATGTALASIQNVTMQATVGAVTAQGNESIMVPGRISYQLPKKNAIVKINGLSLSSNIENVTASGTIVINAKAKIYSIEAKLKANDVKARGVWDIEENDLILLLAA